MPYCSFCATVWCAPLEIIVTQLCWQKETSGITNDPIGSDCNLYAIKMPYIHTYFICRKLSIIQYKYYVDSNGRLPEKLVLIMLAARLSGHMHFYSRITKCVDGLRIHIL